MILDKANNYNMYNPVYLVVVFAHKRQKKGQFSMSSGK